ncbi:MAG: LacI family DNA-binding transcriptional regulator [Sphaerochaetaceae bacterium]|nr:LacI family DNA-binding transcriptional regulator [Sphaerochaetaceae bacterium]
MKPTVKDIAKLAGVSIATVSYVINNGPKPVSVEARGKVLDAIAKTGYQPNALARSLKTERTQTIGLLIPDIADPFFTGFITGVEQVAREWNYNVFLCNTGRNPSQELHYIDLLAQRHVDGLVMAGSMLDASALKLVAANHNAVILSPYSIPDALLYTLDDFDGGYQVGNYLVSKGHVAIRYIEGTWAHEIPHRYAGLQAALKEHGLPTDELLGATMNEVSYEEGIRATVQTLHDFPKTTALSCYNDMVALGAVEACRRLGLRVPEDISVIGFDDIPEASRSRPSLTTVRSNSHEIGIAMTRSLIALLGNKEACSKVVPIPVELIVRESSCPVTARFQKKEGI